MMAPMLISPCDCFNGETTCLFFGFLSRPPEIHMKLNSWNICFDMVCMWLIFSLSRGLSSGMVDDDDDDTCLVWLYLECGFYIDGVVEFWHNLASRYVMCKGELWLKSTRDSSRLMYSKIIDGFKTETICFVMELFIVVEKIMVLDDKRWLDLWICEHVFTFSTSVLKLCVSDYNKDGLVYKSLWLRIQEVDILMLLDLLFSAKFKKSFGIVDHMLMWFVKFMLMVKKETSAFTCWLIFVGGCTSQSCVPWQREIWLRRANQMIDGVTPCELLVLHSDAEVKDSLKRMIFFFDFQVCLLQIKSQDYGYIGFMIVARIGLFAPILEVLYCSLPRPPEDYKIYPSPIHMKIHTYGL
ncbi:unnamed protein product [Cochlearia groenlandica]